MPNKELPEHTEPVKEEPKKEIWIIDWIKMNQPIVQLNICDKRLGYKHILGTAIIQLEIGKPYTDYHNRKKRTVTFDEKKAIEQLNEQGIWQISSFGTTNFRKYGQNWVLPKIVWLNFEKDGRNSDEDEIVTPEQLRMKEIMQMYVRMANLFNGI